MNTYNAYGNITLQDAIDEMYAVVGGSLPQEYHCKPIDRTFNTPLVDIKDVFPQFIRYSMYTRQPDTATSGRCTFDISKDLLYGLQPQPKKDYAYWRGEGHKNPQRGLL